MGRELIEKVFQKFEDHLNIENNNRIVFSGKFGIGKSYFLNEFFKDHKEYFPIFINPVNYSIASNEDIFELIKFDILFQILSKDIIVFEKLNFSKGNLIHQYFNNKFLEDFVSTSDLIGENITEQNAFGSYGILKNLGKLLEKLSELSRRDFQKFEDEIQKNPELEIINSFFKQQEGKIGSFYESNAITQLIYELIKNIEEQTDKKMTLVIDDLDRIDPEHIFRILNIFSAHDKLGENKFGFEKVILVCDINNIKHIYHHFYGENVDFFGYINKFYTTEVYHYSNADYTLIFKSEYYSEKFLDLDNIRMLGFLFSDAISKHFITTRQLFNIDFSKNSVQKYYEAILRNTFYASFEGTRIINFQQYIHTYALLSTAINYFGDSLNFTKYINYAELDIILFEFGEEFINIFTFLDFKKQQDNGITYRSNYSFNYIFDSKGMQLVPDSESKEIKKSDIRKVLLDAIKQFDNIIIN